MLRERIKGYPYPFLFYYILIYMSVAVYGTFMPAYLDGTGFSRTTVGLILGVGPLVAMVCQPLWGLAGDRAKSKNAVLKILLLGSAVSIALFPLSASYYYIFGIMIVFSSFNSSIFPIMDTITLEHLETRGWKYGPIRMGGTVGYCVMVVAAGLLVERNIKSMFPVSFVLIMAAFALSFKLATVKGHQSGGNRVAVWELFRNGELVVLLCFQMVMQISIGFNASFFPLYFREIGGDNSLLGWAMLIAAAGEIPFLFFADRILDKIGIFYALMGSSAILAVRWAVFYFVKNVYIVLPISILHGGTFIVIVYCLIMYINRHVPRELRTSGQTLNALIGMGAARIIGSVLGGVLGDISGVRQVYLYSSLLCLLALVAFGSIFLIGGKFRKCAADAD